ncbi:ferredoxin-NADP reductase [Stenotrophomonas pictorum JCM 9942]|jgi:ferredoxin--NADP+ reductase|uniref:Ferredoxin--NADP reductase n=1 Tax=Stenotrophomonas pictorum JCM 9942 TaxID=1236960 RepID=A0A0R0ADQ3_9GAMM|nr:ferredoxin--NADP reductase [Stenotrophomonas pictorum]KRG42805.1 ferredoxin-NADP reductase [Stenotrophomonas pictorum JCM 9942]
MSSAFGTETVLEVRHWTDAYFSFSTTRDAGFRFENGQFVMIGLENEGGRPLMRAYSIASANWEEQLHFFSIKVQDGPLTSRLQHLKPGDKVLVGKKPTGTLLISDLHPGKHLYLLGTGTGLAPWLSIIKDPETYERFDKVILTHGVRFEQDLAYREYFEKGIFEDEILGDIVRDKLLYYPAVTREPFRNHGRLTALMESGQMQETLGLPPMDPANDRFMICGSPQMLADLRSVLDVRGFQVSPRIGQLGHYVFERAFVEK